MNTTEYALILAVTDWDSHAFIYSWTCGTKAISFLKESKSWAFFQNFQPFLLTYISVFTLVPHSLLEKSHTQQKCITKYRKKLHYIMIVYKVVVQWSPSQLTQARSHFQYSLESLHSLSNSPIDAMRYETLRFLEMCHKWDLFSFYNQPSS